MIYIAGGAQMACVARSTESGGQGDRPTHFAIRVKDGLRLFVARGQFKIFAVLIYSIPGWQGMSKKNPYALGGKKGRGGEREVRAAPYTEEQQVQKLVGYVNVPPQYWPFIKYSTHVRYIQRSGEFRSGGFILKNPFDTKVKGGPEKRFFKLQNGFNRGARDYKEWILAYEDVEYMYAKGTAVELTVHNDLQTAVTTLNSNVQRLATYCKRLEKRVAALEAGLE